MARRIGDAEVLRATLISTCLALVTVGSPRERLEHDQESLQLAKRAQDRIQILRGYLRLAFDYAELGDMAGLDSNIAAYAHGAREFTQQQYLEDALRCSESIRLRSQLAAGLLAHRQGDEQAHAATLLEEARNLAAEPDPRGRLPVLAATVSRT